MRTSNAIKKLTQGCVDDERTLRNESHFVRGAERKQLLSRLADERQRFIHELEELDDRRRGARTPHASMREMLRELRRTIRAWLGGRNGGDAIADCRHSQRRVEALYERVLALPWGGGIADVVHDQYDRVRAERQALTLVQF